MRVRSQALILILLLCGCALCLTLTAFAGDDPAPEAESYRWRAWLCDDRYNMVMVDDSGEALRQVNPSTLTTSGILPGTMRVSTNGEFIAFVTANDFERQVRVYDTIAQRMRGIHILEDASLIPTPPIFNTWDTKIAFAYTFPDGTWRILITDTQRGEIKAVLDSDSESLPGAVQRVDSVNVHRFHEYRVFFTVDAPDKLEDALTPGYVWDILTNTVTESVAYSTVAEAQLYTKTGETLMVMADHRLPGETDTANSVHIYDPYEDMRYPFYASEFIPRAAFFIQNGQRVLVHGRDTEHDNLWFVVARDGLLVRFLGQLPRRDIHGTTEGFLYLYDTPTGESELIESDSRRMFRDETVWRQPGVWSLVWVENHIETYGPFQAGITQAEAIHDAPVPEITVSATPLPPLPQALYPGMDALVQANGDVLYLRANPGTGQEILMHLFDEEVVRLLEGPKHAEGYRWWRLRTENGTEGWAVEAVEAVTTLLPQAG